MLLLIETSSTICSVAVVQNGVVVDVREDREKNAHARRITQLIDELLKANRLSLGGLDAIAVSAGPGSYTGLRIGVAVAKGLCYALHLPLIAVSTLQALAEGIKQATATSPGTYYLPLIDARRMDVYAALYDSEGREVMPPGFFTLNDDFMTKCAPYPVIKAGGDASVKAQSILNSEKFQFIPSLLPHARFMAAIAAERLERKIFEDVAYFEPRYVNESYATIPHRKT